MPPIECLKCRRTVSPQIHESLEGLCLECLSGFVLGQDEGNAATGGASDSQGGAPSAQPLPVEVGATFHKYEVLELIARGGMGVVYKARQLDLERIVALKIMSPVLAADPEFAKRFNGEAKVLALLSHPNIVQVFDFGRSGELYFLAMEYVEGVSLRELLKRGPLEGAQLVDILSQVCNALEHAHQHKVVHRDIKPENILLDRNGRVRIADFGLAKIVRPENKQGSVTQVDLVMGTPKYMAPEQSESLAGADHRADIYSLGVVLYEMLTGEAPYGVYRPPSSSAGVSSHLDEVVLRALERLPERRYQSASQLKTELETATRSRDARKHKSGASIFGHLKERLLSRTAVILGGVLLLAAAATAYLIREKPVPSGPYIDLLKLIDPKLDAVQGQWEFSEKALVSPIEPSARLQIPFVPPDEYDLTIVLERMEGVSSIDIGLASGGRQFHIDIDGWSNGETTGLNLIDGRPGNMNETAYHGRLIPFGSGASGLSNSKLIFVCSVRRNSVALHAQDKLIFHWKGDFARLTAGQNWKLPRSDTLWVGAWRTRFRIHALNLLPVSQGGKRLREESAQKSQ